MYGNDMTLKVKMKDQTKAIAAAKEEGAKKVLLVDGGIKKSGKK